MPILDKKAAHFDPRLLDAFTGIASQLYAMINGKEDWAVDRDDDGLGHQAFFQAIQII